MVYDPIRDCEVPSPSVEAPRHSEGWRYETPGSAYSEDPRYGGVSGASKPPAFTAGATSPSVQPHRSASVGLMGILNDEGTGLRRDSAQTVSAASAWSEEEHRPSIHRLLNDAAPPISKSNSASSLTHSAGSPSRLSPGSHRQIDHQTGFLTPATPAAAQLRASRSPHPPTGTMSPPSAAGQLPYHDPAYARYYEGQAGPSHMRQVAANGQRPMLPPDSIPRQAEYYDSARSTPSAQALLLRSSSVSVSPRGHHATLPYAHTTSRPGSATSTGAGSFSFHPPPQSAASPSTSTRPLSEDPPLPPSDSTNSNGRRATLPARRLSHTSAHSHSTHVRSPEPVHRAPYHPHRISEPTTVLYPITLEEISHFKSVGMSNNPLRRKRKRTLPSWSAPSPAARHTPAESDSSYFPPQEERPGSSNRRSTSFAGRRDSISSAGRPSITPGPSMGGHHDEPAATPLTEVKGAPRGRHASEPEGKHLKRPTDHEDDGHDVQRRKVSETHFVGSSAVADHYNARPEVGVQHREFSPIIGLKKFNNWIKSVLIGKFSYRPLRGSGAKVLDIGCGKGGDLQKWKQARIQLYVGMDIAATSIEQAEERYRRLHRPGFEGYFYAHDCFSKPISDVLPDPLKHPGMYDNVSMQFCMHYAFESPSKARMMIENVSRYLRPGGILIGTIPNADLLLARLAEIPEDTNELKFGNSVYFIQFQERTHKGMYGHQYRFFLTDAVEDVPEYVVNWDNFVSLAMEYRLRLVYKKPFNEILTEEAPSRDFGPLLGKMGVLNEQGESMMDEHQWEAAMLYMGFAFEKM